jgi:hypothetical protein
MDRYSVDYNNLGQKINSPKIYKYENVKHLLQKVAFDVYKFNTDNIDGLWKIESTDNGEVIVAQYGIEESGLKAEASINKKAFESVSFGDYNEDIDNLWDVQATDDGDSIVAMYEGDIKVSSKKPSWDVIPSKKGKVNFFYKGDLITSLASSVFGAHDDIPSLCKIAANKLNNDKSFQERLLKDLTISERSNIFGRYPELTE